MKEAILKLSVDDDFEKGMCYDCPMSLDDGKGGDYCSLGAMFDECPLEVEERK